MSRRDSFLKRWSDRKQGVQRAEPDGPESEGQTRSVSGPDPDSVVTSTADLPGVSIGEPIVEHTDTAALPQETSAADQRDDAVENVEAETLIVDDTADESESTLDPLLSDEDMPEISTLTASSDLTGFFNRGVSATLRRAALRHVFQLPSYNIRDGLNDYDDDFTNFEPLGDTVTSDMKWHAARKERERLERERLEEEARQLDEARLAESDAASSDEDDEVEADDAVTEKETDDNRDLESVEASGSSKSTLDKDADNDSDDNNVTADDADITDGNDDPAGVIDENNHDELLPS